MAPRLSAKPKTTTPARQAPVREGPAPMGDNSMQGEEAERVQLISFVSKLSQADAEIERLQAPLAAAKKGRSKITSLAKAAGFTAEELKKRMEEMNSPTRDMPLQLARETRHRRWLGITKAEQEEIQLGDKVPQDAKDEAHWKGEGYKAGLRQLSSTPPTECGARFVQAFMKEHERGLQEVLEANAPKPLRQKAEDDFKADNPEVDIKKAAAKLKNDAAFMDRTPPADEVLSSAASNEGTKSNTDPEEGFEATEEELQAQPTRRAVQDAASESTSGGDVV